MIHTKYKIPLITLFFFVFLLPASFVRESMGMDHHTATMHGFEYFFLNGFQFGKDFIDNVGPYGFLHYPFYYTGNSFYLRILSFMLVTGFFSYVATLFVLEIKSVGIRLATILILLQFSFQDNFPMFSYEIIPRLSLFLGGLALANIKELTRGEVSKTITVMVFFSYLSLQKTTNMHLALFITTIMFIYFLTSKKYRISFIIAGSYIAGLALLWLFAGQDLLLFPGFYFSSLQFGAAYQEALSMPSKNIEYLYGFSTLAVIAATVLIRFLVSILTIRSEQQEGEKGTSRLIKESIYLLLFSATFFISWKHGMIGTGLHTGIYFNFIASVSPFLFFYQLPGFSPGHKILRSLQTVLSLFLFIGLLILIQVFFSSNPTYRRTRPFDFLTEGKDRLITLVTYFFNNPRKSITEQLDQLKDENKIPDRIRKTIGEKRVDEFGYLPQILLLNQLNYHPRPVPINFVAVNNSLKTLNKDFYKNDLLGPDFIFADISGTFTQNPGLQIRDSGAFLEILNRYTPVDNYKSWIILKREADDASNNYAKDLIETKTVHFGETVPIPAPKEQNEIVWTEMEIQYSFLGKIVKAFLKPPKLALWYTDSIGRQSSQVVSTVSVNSGFVSSPIIKDNKDLMRFFFIKNSLAGIKNVRMDYELDYYRSFFIDSIKLNFYSIIGIQPESSTDSASSIYDKAFYTDSIAGPIAEATTDSGVQYDIPEALDKNEKTFFELFGYGTSEVVIDLRDTNYTKGYTLRSGANFPERMPKSWLVFGGEHKSNLKLLDKRSNVFNWKPDETKRFRFQQGLKIRYLKFIMTEQNTPSVIRIYEIGAE